MSTFRLATRSSPQALAQADAVARAIETEHPGTVVELVHVETLGDSRRDVALHEIGGQGVFVKEVQAAVLAGDADLAVHSAKDLMSTPTDGLVIGAFGRRRDARDALVGRAVDDLERGATVATGSVRRRAQLRAVRPDLEFVELRGNIGTRLDRVPQDGSIVIAVAALEILGVTDRIAERLDPERFVPQVGQGAVAVECRTDDERSIAVLAAVDHRPTRDAVTAERAFLAEIGSGCALPIGAHVRAGVLWTFLERADGAVHRARHDLGDDPLGVARRAAHDAVG